MTGKIWIKLYIEILDDPKMGEMPNHLWKLAVQLFLLAGKQNRDGELPSVTDMAWTFRLTKARMLAYLHYLSERMIVHEAEPGKWLVTHFAKRQAAITPAERMRDLRIRNSDVTKSNMNSYGVGGDASTSPSDSDSLSDSDSDLDPWEGVQREGADCPDPPKTPEEAAVHPDLGVLFTVTGGKLPPRRRYGQAIEALRYLRRARRLDEAALRDYLSPYWQAWAGRTRQDGRPYDPRSLTWLVEWALNESIPPAVPGALDSSQAQAEIIRRVAGGRS